MGERGASAYDGDEAWITPEFTWDPTNSFLTWTENRFPDGYRYQFPASFSGYLEQAEALLSSPDPSVDQLEVGLEARAVLRRLPAAGDRGAVVLEGGAEAHADRLP